MESILEWIIIGLLGGAALAWALVRSFGEATAEEIAKEVVAEMARDARLARELEQFRGTQRQEFRIKSYSALWATMDPLAIYSDSDINADSMRLLSSALTKWYFSEAGGLMLTSVARSFYFALQDLVRSVSTIPGWKAARSDAARPDDDLRQRLRAYLEADREDSNGGPEIRRQQHAAVKVLDELKDIDTRAWPPVRMEERAKGWKDAVDGIPKGWREIDPRDQFAILQQVSSALRTVLTADLESRIR